MWLSPCHQSLKGVAPYILCVTNYRFMYFKTFLEDCKCLFKIVLKARLFKHYQLVLFGLSREFQTNCLTKSLKSSLQKNQNLTISLDSIIRGIYRFWLWRIVRKIVTFFPLFPHFFLHFFDDLSKYRNVLKNIQILEEKVSF